jgi:uncharacterized lipoprotein YddW (UPF0748 family)
VGKIRRIEMVRTVAAIVAFLAVFVVAKLNAEDQFCEGRAIWSHGPDVWDPQTVKETVEHCRRANIHIIVLCVKGGDGRIQWHSKKFAECIDEDFLDFDPLKALIEEAHKVGIKVHAWLCDYPEAKWTEWKKEFTPLAQMKRILRSLDFADDKAPNQEQLNSISERFEAVRGLVENVDKDAAQKMADIISQMKKETDKEKRANLRKDLFKEVSAFKYKGGGEQVLPPAAREHPEWTVKNPEGTITTDEKLGMEQYGTEEYDMIWYCPARRPGYTDMWLIPMVEEVVANYDVDGIHHDYVRYPGDVAPDRYCFCDYCLEDFWKYNHFYYECRPKTKFSPEPVLPDPVSNWWLDYTVRPLEWDKMSRKEKAELIMKGSSMPGGPSDLDYFFYEYRSDAITRFCRDVWLAARKIKPEIEFSAAVFKNPAQSGRYIGQRWNDFAPWVDIMMTMTYRSHFPGTFEDYLDMLTEYTRYQNMWCENLCHVYVGIASHYLYREEYEPVQKMRKALTKMESEKDQVQALRGEFVKISGHLKTVAPALESEIAADIETLSAKVDKDVLKRLDKSLERLLTKDAPAGYYPEEKLIKAVEAIRKGGGEGIVIFCGSYITDRKQWGALEKAFSKPSVEPYLVKPIDTVGIQAARLLRQKTQEVGELKQQIEWLKKQLKEDLEKMKEQVEELKKQLEEKKR